jgi:hypothetical protein
MGQQHARSRRLPSTSRRTELRLQRSVPRGLIEAMARYFHHLCLGHPTSGVDEDAQQHRRLASLRSSLFWVHGLRAHD